MNPDNSAGVLAPPPLIYIAGVGVGFALEALLPGTQVDGVIRWPLGIVLVVVGSALDMSFMRRFSKAGTPLEPWKPTSALVTDGPYRFTRNPAYLGMALIGCGVGVLADALWVLAGAAAAVVVVDRGVIVREERYLGRLFGDEYAAYRRRVRRWV